MYIKNRTDHNTDPGGTADLIKQHQFQNVDDLFLRVVMSFIDVFNNLVFN